MVMDTGRDAEQKIERRKNPEIANEHMLDRAAGAVDLVMAVENQRGGKNLSRYGSYTLKAVEALLQDLYDQDPQPFASLWDRTAENRPTSGTTAAQRPPVPVTPQVDPNVRGMLNKMTAELDMNRVTTIPAKQAE